MYAAIFFVLFVTAASLGTLFAILFINKSKEFNTTFERFKDVIDIEKEIKTVEKSLYEKRKGYEKYVETYTKKEIDIKENYAQKRNIYDKLVREINILEEQMDDISYGLYKPHFDFDMPEKYKVAISKNWSMQQEMVRSKNAAVCRKEWEVGGSKSEGKKMVNRSIKLMLRAFNNECDSAVLKVRWNNVVKMRERVTKAYEAINKLGEPVAIEINSDYLGLKLDEISLTYEYQEKLQSQKEEQRRIREQMREEEKARQEIEKAIQNSMREEEMYNNALKQAREEMEHAQGEKLEKLQSKIALLEVQLKETIEKGKRAQSMAEKTKSGHVYIISNIGSFGKNIYKIGLTRRLEPLDRVKELGDASVPFPFDVHAMIYSENAPDLEYKFHQHFSNNQVNLVNSRKEFFEVNLKEIENYANQNGLKTEFTELAEAKEYRESIAIKQVNNKDIEQQNSESSFPLTL